MCDKLCARGGTSDIQAAVARQGSSNDFEFSHLLDDADNAHDFSLSVGQTVGFALTVVIDDNWITDIPGFGTFPNPSTYANYVVALQHIPSQAGPVGGFMEPVNKLAVFGPYLALFGAVATVAVVVWKKRED